MNEKDTNFVELTNKSAFEIRNCINAFVMICEYNGQKTGYHPIKILKRKEDGTADFDVFVNIKACQKEIDANICIKIAETEELEDGKFYVTEIGNFTISQLNESAVNRKSSEIRLSGDPYEFKETIVLSMGKVTFGEKGYYAILIDTKTSTGKNIILDACYFEVI